MEVSMGEMDEKVTWKWIVLGDHPNFVARETK